MYIAIRSTSYSADGRLPHDQDYLQPRPENIYVTKAIN